MSKPNQRKQCKQKARVKRVAKARAIAKANRTRVPTGFWNQGSQPMIHKDAHIKKLRNFDREKAKVDTPVCFERDCSDPGVNTTACSLCDYSLVHCSYHLYKARREASAHIDKKHPEAAEKANNE